MGIQAFATMGNTVTFTAASTAPSAVQAESKTLGGNQYRIINTGTVTVFLGYATSASDAANNAANVATSLPLLSSTDEILSFVPNAYFTGKTASGTAVVYITPGDGLQGEIMLKVAGGGIATGTLTYQGTWNASTNSPTLASGVGTLNNYYVVSTAGSTNLDGITDWQIGDWAIFNGTVWQKIDNSEVTYVSNVATGTGLTGGPITTTGTIAISNTAVTAASYGAANTVGTFTVNAQGQLTAAANAAIAISVGAVSGAVPNTVNVLAGTGMSGGGALTANVTLTLANTAITAATYGNATHVSQVTFDAQGRATAASNVAISIPSGNVTGLGTMATQNANAVAITGGTIVASNVTVTSNLNANLTTNVSATFATDSLPLVPEGYLTININGAAKKVPYYGV